MKGEKKKIFIIGYSENKGGVEQYIALIANNLSKKKFHIYYSLPIMDIDGKRWVRPLNRHNYFKYYFFWKRFFKENHFDAVYYNTCDIVSIDMLKFAKYAGIPIRIIHSHSSSNQRKLNIWHKYEEKKNRKNLKKYATHLFACSKVAGEWMFGQATNYKIIDNAIEVSKFQYQLEKRLQGRRELNIMQEFVVGMVGRLSNEKNPEFGVNVFSSLHKKIGNAKLLMVGDGERRNNIQSMIDVYNFEGNIQLLGVRDDIDKIMSVMDCLLLPSKFEGFPFVMIEAQAAGLPCIVSDSISRETDLTGNVHFVGLDEPFEVWAQKIIDVGIAKDRENGAKVLKEKGYDISDNIDYIERILLNEENL